MKPDVRCPIHGCRKLRRYHKIMCSDHWFACPERERNLVMNEYWNGRGSPAHMAAIKAAIAEVNRLQANEVHHATR